MEQCELRNVCRACLTEEGEFQSVFVPEVSSGISLHISEMMNTCTSIQITLGDGLPEQICTACVSNTVHMYLFKMKCERSDRILRERLERGNYYCDDDLVKLKTTYDDEIIKNEVLDNGVTTKEDILDIHIDNIDFDTYRSDGEEEVLDQPDEEPFPKGEIKEKKFECDVCQKRFSRYDLLLRHKIAHAMKMEEQNVQYDGTYQVDDMDIKRENGDLDAHMKTHEKEYTVSCDVCQKKFSKLSHRNRHLRTMHFIKKEYKCSMCEKAFHKQEQLRNHINVHKGAKPHVCDICCKAFNQISNLKDHMRTHNGEKPFLCSTCGKGFNQLGNLRQHTVRHSGVKAHLCSTCGSGFASKGELSAHLRKHTGARPFVCTVCNHGFTTSSSLTKHKRIHSGEKPYECDTCKMKFSRSGILARHKRTHTGEKPYKCKFCDKAFSQSNDLTSHQRIHTGEKPFICDECGQAFRQSSALKTHKKTHASKPDPTEKIERDTSMEVKPILLTGMLNSEFLPGFS
ncbi:hypothetical protein JTB14_031700 [Gonioctena quinquepunctata]|nr:hypothetical protein JTB14_031700 [Gonioctena quinquepunctata]